MANDSGTIDITDAVNGLEGLFVQSAELYLYGVITAIPMLGWLAAPVVKVLFGDLLTWLLDKLAKWEIMQSFFLNTALRKASQAQDFVSAINAKNNLPPTASDDEYEEKERAQMVAFKNFVAVTN